MTNQKVVLGISGGGDSNTLIDVFLRSGRFRKDQLIAVMMMGIPDWDLGKPRAQKICNDFGIELQYVTAERVGQLLKRNISNGWVEDFEKHFPGIDLEALGTLAIRLSLNDVAKKEDAQAVVLGLNLEDILGGSIIRVLQGKLPLPFPVLEVDGIKYWYPLYRCPKKILDGCHPKFSLQNYMDRYKSVLVGRAIPYYLAQMFHTILPGIEFDLINGFKKLGEQNVDCLQFDQDLGMSAVGILPLKDRKRWKDFLEGKKID